MATVLGPLLTASFMKRFLRSQQAPANAVTLPASAELDQQALGVYVQLKRAVRERELEVAVLLSKALKDHPRYAQLAKIQLDRAYLCHALMEARRLRGRIQGCAKCLTANAFASGRTNRCVACGARMMSLQPA